MRPWHETELNENELTESFDDSMVEAGLDPQNDDDRRAFTDQTNREAIELGLSEKHQTRDINHETGEAYPPFGNWLADGPIGRHLLKD